MAIVRKVLGEFDGAELIARATIQELIAFRNEKALTITVNPQAVPQISKTLALHTERLQFEFVYKIEGDPALPLSVCVIATEFEVLEASLDGQLQALLAALTAAAADAGAHGYRLGICDDDPEGLRALLDDQTLRADLIVTTGGTGSGPGDMVRRILARGPVTFTDVSVYPGSSLGFGTIGGAEVPIVCLPGDPGSALIGFEVLARPVIQILAGAEPVFRPSVRAHLLETVYSPAGLREFRPAYVTERRGGGYTVTPRNGGPYTLSGLSEANGLLVLGEKVMTASAGSTVDVLLLDRRR